MSAQNFFSSNNNAEKLKSFFKKAKEIIEKSSEDEKTTLLKVIGARETLLENLQLSNCTSKIEQQKINSDITELYNEVKVFFHYLKTHTSFSILNWDYALQELGEISQKQTKPDKPHILSFQNKHTLTTYSDFLQEFDALLLAREKKNVEQLTAKLAKTTAKAGDDMESLARAKDEIISQAEAKIDALQKKIDEANAAAKAKEQKEKDEALEKERDHQWSVFHTNLVTQLKEYEGYANGLITGYAHTRTTELDSIKAALLERNNLFISVANDLLKLSLAEKQIAFQEMIIFVSDAMPSAEDSPNSYLRNYLLTAIKETLVEVPSLKERLAQISKEGLSSPTMDEILLHQFTEYAGILRDKKEIKGYREKYNLKDFKTLLEEAKKAQADRPGCCVC